MSFNGITAYGDFLPSSQYSEILLNYFYIEVWWFDRNSDVYMIRNGQYSYCLIYNLEINDDSGICIFDVLQYSSPSGYGRYILESFEHVHANVEDWVPQYIYQGTNDYLGGNCILMSGFDDHIRDEKIENTLTVCSILLGVSVLFSVFVQFFKKILF